MDSGSHLAGLVELAERLGIEVRQVNLGGEGGGLCEIRGKRVLFVDKGASVEDQVGRTAEALSGMVGLEEMYIVPEVREILEQYGRGG